MSTPIWITIAVVASLATFFVQVILLSVRGSWWERPLRVVVAVLAILTAIASGGIYHGGELQVASVIGMAVFGSLGLYSLGKLVR